MEEKKNKNQIWFLPFNEAGLPMGKNNNFIVQLKMLEFPA